MSWKVYIDRNIRENIKPRQIEDLGGELKATKYHLSDMRNLVKGEIQCLNLK